MEKNFAGKIKGIGSNLATAKSRCLSQIGLEPAIRILCILSTLLITSIPARADSPCEIIVDVRDALNGCSKAIEQDKHQNPILLDERADLWIQTCEFDQAIKDENEVLSLSPKMQEAWIHRGTAWHGKGELDRALSDLTSALQIDPNNIDALTRRSSVYGAQGMLMETIADATRAITSGLKVNRQYQNNHWSPQIARSFYNRALARKLQGDYKSALMDYTRAVQQYPLDPNNWRKLPANWSKMPLSKQVEFALREVRFSHVVRTSPANIDAHKVAKTRYGKLILTRENTVFDAVFFKGKTLMRANWGMLNFSGIYRVGNHDVVVVRDNPGGSNTPDSLYTFILVYPNGITKIASSPVEIVSDEAAFKLIKNESGILKFSLGYAHGRERTVQLVGRRMMSKLEQAKKGFLNLEACTFLYENFSETCNKNFVNGATCQDISRHVGLHGDAAQMGNFRTISNLPGYKQSGVDAACQTWCQHKVVSFDRFAATACSRTGSGKKHHQFRTG